MHFLKITIVMSETTIEEVQQHLAGNEVAANLEFLRTAGLLDSPMPFLNDNEGSENRVLQDLTKAIDALAGDVSEQMASFGRRLEVLEVRSVPETPAEPDNTSPTPEALPNPTPDGSSTPEVRSRSRATRSTPVNNQSTPWSERSLTEPRDYEEILVWPDEDDDQNNHTSKLSENTNKLLQESFLKAVPNQSRRAMREKFGDPRCPPTRVPKLDKMVKDRISQETVRLDRSMARLQALLLDAVGPMASILEEDENGTLTTEKAVTAAKMALRFVGNASVQMPRERRRRAISEMNNKLIELSEKDSIYEKAPPLLFGDQFAKEAKEREEQLRCLDKASNRGKPQPFYNRRPQAQRRGGGGHSSRQGANYGYGRGRFHPYGHRFGQQAHRGRGKENFLKGAGKN